MKALVYTGPQQIEYSDAPDPVPLSDEVLVKIEAVGICGSDMHAYQGHDDRRPAPLILGHEASGIAGDGRYAGQRVTMNPLVTCNECDYCTRGQSNLCPRRQIVSMPPRPGAFAEYIRIPERNLVPCADTMDPVNAALCEPIATAWHAVMMAKDHLRSTGPDPHILILGGGAIGLSAALILRSQGFSRISIAETNGLRRQTALNEKTFTVFDPASQGAEDSHFAVIIDAVGSTRTRELASAAVRPGGLIVHIGLLDDRGGLDIRRLTLQEISFVGTYTYTMKDFQETVHAVATGSLGDLQWAATRPLAQGAEAFADLLAGRSAAAKIVLIP